MKNHNLLITLLFGCVLSMTGCSTVVVEPYSKETYKDGIRFYRPAPYILVSPTLDEKGNIVGTEMSIRYLPDYRQEYVVRSWTFIGSVTMKPGLTDGWNLVALESSVDPKFAETVTALVGAAKLGMPMTPQGVQPPSTAPVPGLYKLILPTKENEFPRIEGPISFGPPGASSTPTPTPGSGPPKQ